MRRSPLAARGDDLARIGAREVPFPAQLSVRVDPTSVAGAAPWSLEPNTWIDDGAVEAIWLGPDEWLLVGAPGTAAGIVGDLEGRLANVPHSIVDVSANRAVIDLENPGRFDVLAQGCSLDLDDRVWRRGMCAQTLLASVPVLLQQRDATTRVFARPSYANWLVDWLLAVST